MRKFSILVLYVVLLAACNDEPIREIAVTSFSPNSEGVGNTVQLMGLGFGQDASVININFNGVQAELLSFSDTLIVTKVPSGATTGPINIQVGDQSISTSVFTILPGTWTEKQAIPSDVGFGAAVGFALDGRGYVGTGGDNGRILGDFWQYDPVNDQWSALSVIPGGSRRFSSSFVIENKAYIGLGVKDNETTITREVYALDLNTVTWNRLEDFPGTLPVFRDAYAVFVIGNLAYLILGKELWSYNPASDIWSQVANYPGVGSSSHIAEVVDDVVYIGLGFSDAFDWWSYDPLTDQWCSLSAFPGEATWGLQSFKLQDKIYVVGKECWEYDPTSDQWAQMNSHPDGRMFGVAFTLGGTGYFGTGTSITRGFPFFVNDFWAFSPN